MIGPPRRLAQILCVIDGSRGAEEALHQALRLASADEGKVTFVVARTDEESVEGWAPTEMQARAVLELALERADRNGVEADAILLRGSSVSGGIVSRTHAFDIVVLADRRSHGHGGSEIGEVPKRVAAAAGVPVLIARRRATPREPNTALQVVRGSDGSASFTEKLDAIARSESGPLLVG